MVFTPPQHFLRAYIQVSNTSLNLIFIFKYQLLMPCGGLYRLNCDSLSKEAPVDIKTAFFHTGLLKRAEMMRMTQKLIGNPSLNSK